MIVGRGRTSASPPYLTESLTDAGLLWEMSRELRATGSPARRISKAAGLSWSIQVELKSSATPITSPTQILKQAKVALEHASRVIFVVDGRAEIYCRCGPRTPAPAVAEDRQASHARCEQGPDTGAERSAGPRFLFELRISKIFILSPPSTGWAWTRSCSTSRRAFPRAPKKNWRQTPGSSPAKRPKRRSPPVPSKSQSLDARMPANPRS